MLKKMTLSLLILLFSQLALQPATPAHADTKWRARYWNNHDLEGDTALKRDESNIDHDWGDDAPEGVDKDHFSARWTRDVEFTAGLYRFIATTDDGMRVYIDGNLVIDSWYDSQVHAVTADVHLEGGWHHIKVEYYEAGGDAVAKLTWIAQPSEPSVIYNWRGEYYNNTDLFYPPARVSDDTAVNFDWGYLAPLDGVVGADHFSARWTRTLPFTAGTYQFTIMADDGVRLWVNNQLVIDVWQEQTETTLTANVALPTGNIPIKLEYFESGGKAYVHLDWQATNAAPTAPITTATPIETTATAVAESAPLETLQARMINAIHLTVRAEPNLEGESLGYLSRNQVVAITGYRSGGWVQVILPTGEVGWAGGSYLQLGKPFVDLAIWQE